MKIPCFYFFIIIFSEVARFGATFVPFEGMGERRFLWSAEILARHCSSGSGRDG